MIDDEVRSEHAPPVDSVPCSQILIFKECTSIILDIPAKSGVWSMTLTNPHQVW